MTRASRRSGRISFVALAAIVSVALVCMLFMLSGPSARTAAGAFMSALAKGDVNKLTELSVVQDKSPDQIKKEWQETVDNSRSYVFGWNITAVNQEKDSATIRLDVIPDPTSPSAYPHHYELQMVKVKDAWKVDVPQIARDMYPYLPE